MIERISTDDVRLFEGDCIEVMRTLPDASVDSIVTDPPYGLGFMGREWDDLPPGLDFAVEALRVLKPGGHMLAFGGTRTWHRLAVAVEDAGFEIRDSLAYMYGSGFPKSLDASKALNGKRCGCAVPYNHANVSPEGVRDVRLDVAADNALPGGSEPHLLEALRREGAEPSSEGATGAQRPAGHGGVRGVLDAGHTAAGVGEAERDDLLLAPVQRRSTRSGAGEARQQGPRGVDSGERSLVPGEDDGRTESGLEGRRDPQQGEGELRRAEVCAVPTGVPADGAEGRVHHGASARDGSVGGQDADAPGVRESHQPRPAGQPAGEPGDVPDERGSQAWGGWSVCERCSQPIVPDGLGTALKPAFEPIVVARKPIQGTVASNVLAYGTGALNIDASRIAHRNAADLAESAGKNRHADFGTEAGGNAVYGDYSVVERTNYDGSRGRFPANVILDESQAAELDKQSGESSSKSGGTSGTHFSAGEPGVPTPDRPRGGHNDSGGASRFFYTAKADSAERPVVDGIAHPTVKPLGLMRYLVRLVTPRSGLVLEPFAGSGTTLQAALEEGCRVIGIERESDYIPLIKSRLDRPINQGLDIFGGVA